MLDAYRPFPYIVVVKKTLRYSYVFFYNYLYRNSFFQNLSLEGGIMRLPNWKYSVFEMLYLDSARVGGFHMQGT